MRVAVVNDMRMALEVLRRIIQSMSDADVAWTAEDGQQAVDRCLQDRPDMILMDMIMPVMNGVEATRRIMTDCPCTILVTTANVQTNISYVYEALGCGAVDAINTPVLGPGGSLSGAQELIRKMRQLMRLRQNPLPCAVPVRKLDLPPLGSSEKTAPPLVAIGASTGGPQVLKNLLASLQVGLSYSFVIVQHLDEIFVPGFVQWLNEETRLPVQTAKDGQQLVAGTVSVACTTNHLVLDKDARLRYVEEPAGYVYRPSVDVFFNSLLDASVAPGVAVLLTGMGQDGAAGLQRLKQCGWQTIAQDEATSVVWGMPGAAVRMGAADHVVSADAMGPAIARAMRSE